MKIAKVAKQQVPTLMNGNKDEVNHEQETRPARQLEEKERVEREPSDGGPTRQRTPGFRQPLERRHSLTP